MDSLCSKFMLILVLFERIRSLPLACLYNGTSYQEGESVKTEEPCLSCSCRKGALDCSLRVCAEYTSVLPPACFLVHKPNDCCPQLLCEERLSPIGFELRTGFTLKNKMHGNDCLINGSIYAEGSAVASSRVCEYCYCVEGEIKCIKPRCLQSFEGCKPVYDKSSCCPTHYDCRNASMDYLKTQIENFAKVDSTVSQDSMRSLWSTSTNFTSDEEYFSANESMYKSPVETENTQVDEFAKTTTKDINAEDSTVEPEKESTVPSTQDWVTTISFKTTKGDNFKEESTRVECTEATTFESETDVNVSSLPEIENQKEASPVQTRSTTDFRGGIESSTKSSNKTSTENSDDYDSYDYTEPRLPPSLPNLVIFPFVAADAVVKDKSADVSNTYEKLGIKRIDEQPGFYKDYFSPPVKTEGGFVPKEPPKSDESFYEYASLREQTEPPNAELTENAEDQIEMSVSPVTFSGNCVSNSLKIQYRDILPKPGDCMTCTCRKGAIVCHDVVCQHRKPETLSIENQKEPASFPERNPNVTPTQFREVVQPDTETTSDFLLEDDLMESHENYQTKKPVTVTYKNFAVDFFPNYLITTARGHFKLHLAESAAPKTSEKNHQHVAQKNQNPIAHLTTTRTPPFNFFDETTTSTPMKTMKQSSMEGTEITELSKISLITTQTPFFEEFVKSFLSKDASFERKTETGTGNITAKHKYSSKIKGQIIPTVRPKQEVSREKIKSEVSRVNSTAHPNSWLNSIMKPAGEAAQKPVTTEDTKLPVKISSDQLSASSLKPVDIKNRITDFSQSPAEANPSNKSTKPNAGALLKLAGCNIYGMMYRVGKIITELSGPCLECLCTEVGVQCRPLKC